MLRRVDEEIVRMTEKEVYYMYICSAKTVLDQVKVVIYM